MSKIILDFDHTLFNAEAFKKDLAKALDLNLVKWDKQYQLNKQKYKCYNYKKHLENFPPNTQAKFLKVLKNCQKYLYKDSVDFIKSVRARHVLSLLSKGNIFFQQEKIKNCGLEKYLEIKAVKNNKINFIKKLKNKNKIIFINDRGEEIDEIKEAFPEITAIWIRRRNSKYKNEPCKKFDYKFNNLKNILTINI